MTTDKRDVGLWRLNEVTGYYVLERMCSLALSAVWLKVFQQDNPGATFKLSAREPK